VNKAFEVHMLSPAGKQRAKSIAERFDELLNAIEPLILDGRCKSIVATKLEEACFFAKKGMALDPENHE